MLSGKKAGYGFTLIELLVYMAIMGFIIVVAGRVFSDSAGMRVRSQNMLASAEEAGRISALLKEDISQMGAKGWGVSSASGQAFDSETSVHINYNTDLSSFDLETSSSSFHKLMFKKAHYDANGICRAVKTIEWYVKADSSLYRKCTPTQTSKCSGTFDAAAECPPDEIEMARNVSEFRFLPSKPGTEGYSAASSNADTLFPASATASKSFALVLSNAGTVPSEEVVLGSFSSGVAANYYFSATGTSCSSFAFKADEEYAIEFDLLNKVSDGACITGAATCDDDKKYNKMAMFQPGRDHLSVGLRKNNDPILNVPDFLLYPPQDGNATAIKRHFSFSVPESMEACIGITAAFYSEAADGHLYFRNFKVYRKTDKVYHFPSSASALTTAEKAAVKAFELTLGINKRGEINRVITVIPVPNNGVVPTAGGI
jgi:type II secretory pathway pseudopilin PulG